MTPDHLGIAPHERQRWRPVWIVLLVAALVPTAAACDRAGVEPPAAAERPAAAAPGDTMAGRVPDTEATSLDAASASAPTVTTVPSRPLFDFAVAPPAGWASQDDPVMGGRSSSRAAADNGGLRFRGVVSLENNGGFASTVSPPDDTLGAKAAGARLLRLRGTGDGKTYVVQLRTNDPSRLYIHRFATEAGVTKDYDLPLAGFEPVTFMLTPAADAPAAIDPAAIGQLAIYLTDKQAGPFDLTIERIEAVD